MQRPVANGSLTENSSTKGKESWAAVATKCARILDANKMENIRVLDVAQSLQIADYFVIASGRNPRHLKSAGDEVLKGLREVGTQRRGLEGYREGKWVLIDFDGVVVHLFQGESRTFYDLENLWGDCPTIEWRDGETVAPAPRRSAVQS
ncbi:MAG TPA: ribosome silencing factor [Planctomycetota bacterium]|jgi:ribosome-associated protein|nr:ribosome silencing factor [Planctomycetota bacterium]